jgi:hypothetical protein
MRLGAAVTRGGSVGKVLWREKKRGIFSQSWCWYSACATVMLLRCVNVRLVAPTLAVSRNLVAIRLTRASLANTSTGPPRPQTSKVALHVSIEMILERRRIPTAHRREPRSRYPSEEMIYGSRPTVQKMRCIHYGHSDERYWTR